MLPMLLSRRQTRWLPATQRAVDAMPVRPSAAYIDAMDQMIRELQGTVLSAGTAWSHLYSLGVMYAEDRSQALTNWRDPARNFSPVNDPVFAPHYGLVGDGTWELRFPTGTGWAEADMHRGVLSGAVDQFGGAYDSGASTVFGVGRHAALYTKPSVAGQTFSARIYSVTTATTSSTPNARVFSATRIQDDIVMHRDGVRSFGPLARPHSPGAVELTTGSAALATRKHIDLLSSFNVEGLSVEDIDTMQAALHAAFATFKAALGGTIHTDTAKLWLELSHKPSFARLHAIDAGIRAMHEEGAWDRLGLINASKIALVREDASINIKDPGGARMYEVNDPFFWPNFGYGGDGISSYVGLSTLNIPGMVIRQTGDVAFEDFDASIGAQYYDGDKSGTVLGGNARMQLQIQESGTRGRLSWSGAILSGPKADSGPHVLFASLANQEAFFGVDGVVSAGPASRTADINQSAVTMFSDNSLYEQESGFLYAGASMTPEQHAAMHNAWLTLSHGLDEHPE